MKKKMTDRLIRSITPDRIKRIEICDTERVGLRFRMSTKGNASWLYQKKIKGGVRRGFHLGNYPSMSLAEARSAALQIQVQAERGIDPLLVAQEREKLVEAERLAKKSVKAILDLYVKNHIEQELKFGQSRDERKRQLYAAFSERLDSPISEITRTELQSVIDDKQAEGKVYMANRIRAAIRAFTGWAHKRGHLDQDIGALLQSAGREAPRDRTPSLEEVQAVWAASFEMGHLWGPYIRLCILTGQRSRSDVLQMQWGWIDFSRNRYEIPNPKNGRPHIVHLSDPAIGELQRLKEQQASQPSEFVFTTTGKRAASGVSKAKLRLDHFVQECWTAQGHRSQFQPWVLHDLRRSQATALAEAGFDEGVVDRIQNHVASGSRPSAVAIVYNKAQKLTERAAALDAWAVMVTGRPTNIVQLREA